MWKHLLEWQLVAVDFLAILFSTFIWYSDSRSERHLQNLSMYKDILEKIPTDIAVFDENHRYQYVNSSAIANDELRNWIIGKDDFAYFEFRGYDVALAEKRRAKFEEALELKMPISWIDTLYSKDKGERHVQRTFNPLFNEQGGLDKMFGFGADVTELVDLRIRDADLHANMRYANQIQQYLLPNLSEAMKGIAETFVIWKPRDVVSGDFYWHRKIGNKNLLALADCTGHGVSGALLTVICMDTLNRCVDEHGLTDPADILNKCQDMLSVSWRQGGAKGMYDGMDICLCCFEEERLSFASASTPLYLFRNGTLTEYRGDRLSIGARTHLDHQFSSKEIILNEMDRLYLSTDGIHDQFGGAGDRKFGKPRLRTLISEVGNSSFSEQRQIFYRTFENWRGTREQVDDKAFLGIEFRCKPVLNNAKADTEVLAAHPQVNTH